MTNNAHVPLVGTPIYPTKKQGLSPCFLIFYTVRRLQQNLYDLGEHPDKSFFACCDSGAFVPRQGNVTQPEE